MGLDSYAWIAAVLVTLTSTATLITHDWRVSIGLLAVQFACGFFLNSMEWPLALSISIVAAGWLAASILGMGVLGAPLDARDFKGLPISPAFNLLAAIPILLLVVTFAPQVPAWMPALVIEQSWSALVLLGFGLLRLAFDPDPVSTSAALLSMLLGFELLFSSLSSAYLAVWLLAGITLSIALAGAYLTLSPYIKEDS